MDGPALSWWMGVTRDNVVNTSKLKWSQFSKLCIDRFQTTEITDRSLENLKRLRQTGGVAGYSDLFQQELNNIPYDSLSEHARTVMYVEGLKTAIRKDVMIKAPATLQEAINLAARIDSINVGTGYNRGSKRHGNSQYDYYDNYNINTNYKNNNSNTNSTNTNKFKSSNFKKKSYNNNIHVKSESDDNASQYSSSTSKSGYISSDFNDQFNALLNKSGEAIKCFTCGENHYQNDCPKSKSNHLNVKDRNQKFKDSKQSQRLH